MIRKGIAAGLRSVIDPGIDRFFAAYSESVRNLGTPVFSKRYFAILKEVFGDACEILSVEHHGRVIASVMSFYFRDEVLPYYGGGTEQARDLKGNDFMYWEVMRRAAEKGVRVFDYGRSKEGTGSYRFKTHWGFEPEPLAYEYELIKQRRYPRSIRSTRNIVTHRGVAASSLPAASGGPWISRNSADRLAPE